MPRAGRDSFSGHRFSLISCETELRPFLFGRRIVGAVFFQVASVFPTSERVADFSGEELPEQ